MLSIHRLNAGYGPVKALWDVTLGIDEGEIVAPARQRWSARSWG
jgi:ABC-type branched-subunit amino acid transport system ATPase component